MIREQDHVTVLAFLETAQAQIAQHQLDFNAVPIRIGEDLVESLQAEPYVRLGDVLRLFDGVRIGEMRRYYGLINQARRMLMNEQTLGTQHVLSLLYGWEDFLVNGARRQRARLYLRTKSVECAHSCPMVRFEIENYGELEAQFLSITLLSGNAHLQFDESVPPFPLRPHTTKSFEAIVDYTQGGTADLLFQYAYSDDYLTGRSENCTTRTVSVRASLLGPPRRDFIPLINPYVVGVPLSGLRSEAVYIHRQSDLKTVQGGLGGHVLNLYGLRRVGKTSFLKRLPDLLNAESFRPYLPLYVDVAEVTLDPMKEEREILFSLAYSCYVSANDPLAQPPRLEDWQGPIPPIDLFLSYIRGLNQGAGARELVLVLDEYEALQKAIEAGQLRAELLAALRPERFHGCMSVIFCGTVPLSDVGKGSGGSPHNEWNELAAQTVAKIHVGLLDRDQTDTLVRVCLSTQRTGEPRVEFARSVYDAVWEATGGHAGFVQLICYLLVDYVNNECLMAVERQDVEWVIHRLSNGPNVAHVDYFVLGLTPMQRQVLLALALADHISEPRLSEIMRLAALPAVDVLCFQQAIDELIESNVLSLRENCYFLNIGILRAWTDTHDSC